MTTRGSRRRQKQLKRHKTDKGCNGPCCKNPRRNGWTKGRGKTLEEVRAERQAKGLEE